MGETKVPITNPKMLKDKHSKAGIVVANRFHNREIIKELLEMGIAYERIFNAGKYINGMSKEIYFELPALSYVCEETFVDVGWMVRIRCRLLNGVVTNINIFLRLRQMQIIKNSAMKN